MYRPLPVTRDNCVHPAWVRGVRQRAWGATGKFSPTGIVERLIDARRLVQTDPTSTMDDLHRRVTRRGLLRSAGALATIGLAGCPGDGASGGTEPTETTEATTPNGRPAPEQQLPTPVAGDPDAAVTVAAYEDLACPHCRTYTLEVQPELWSAYVEPGEIRYEWHDFPIPVDPTHSWLAADAGRAVQAEADSIDAFWNFLEAAYERQDDLSLDLYATLANDVGVDGETVRQETEARTYEPTVVADRQAGLDRDVSGTPTVFVDDNRIEGPTLESLQNAIDDALESA